MQFFDANMASPLAAVLARIADKFNAIEIVNVPAAIERILRKNGFLTFYSYEKLADSNLTTIPFRRIQLTDAGRFEDYLGRHLKGKGIPKMTEGLGKVFKQSVFEVFQNSVMHSRSKLGVFACGQFRSSSVWISRLLTRASASAPMFAASTIQKSPPSTPFGGRSSRATPRRGERNPAASA